MDALKLAFDTLVVGALALPWLWLFMRVFFQRGSREQDLTFPLMSALSDTTRQTVAAVLILALGYFLGSAVSRISSDFFDDNDILGRMPTQTSIRQGVYLHEYCDEHSVLAALKLPYELAKIVGGKATFCEARDEQLERLVTEFFRLQEGKLLLEGEEKLGRLRQLHDQIEILRGATLNGQFFSRCPGLDYVRSTGRGLRRANCESCASAGRMCPPWFACSWACGKWDNTSHTWTRPPPSRRVRQPPTRQSPTRRPQTRRPPTPTKRTAILRWPRRYGPSWRRGPLPAPYGRQPALVSQRLPDGGGPDPDRLRLLVVDGGLIRPASNPFVPDQYSNEFQIAANLKRGSIPDLCLGPGSQTSTENAIRR